MQFLEDLQREHEVIETALGALRTYSRRLVNGEAPLSDLARFATFFRIYAGEFHHEAEERVLLPALERASLPMERGPIAVLLADHARMASLQGELWSATDPAIIDRLATEYSHALWQHIDMENLIFFPAAKAELARSGVRELPTREGSPEAGAAAVLAALYPPIVPDSIRGDGCVMCPAYGDTCDGLEREWWNEFEWDELSERVAAT